MKDCRTCKYGYEEERLGIPMCHHPKRFSEDCVDFNMHEEKEIKESEKPINPVDLEKEIDSCWQSWLSPSNQSSVEGVFPKTEFAMYARHFAEWGYLRAAEKYNEIEYNRQRAEESGSSEITNDHDEHVPEIKETGTQGLDEAAKNYALKELERAIQEILDLTKDDSYICDKMEETPHGSEWCRLNCGDRTGPDFVCCKEWLFNHWKK